MKTMDCGLWQGANRSNSCDYCEDEQRRHGPQDAFSCSGICEADHQVPRRRNVVTLNRQGLWLGTTEVLRSTSQDCRLLASLLTTTACSKALAEFP
jgi:hypothetical protein